MADNSNGLGSFMSDNISMKRWKLYRVQFFGLGLGWLAIQNIFSTTRHQMVMAFLFASAVCVYNCWSDMRRTELRRSPTDANS
ncbi:MAG TPA: hypothetical protein VE866_03720 [Candidatus Binatia bacterium]|nr:hypothetical protein [Candidatus Binatia bacterium]